MIELYNDTDRLKIEQKEKLRQNFIQYFIALIGRQHRNSSKSIQVNWNRTIELLKSFRGGNIIFKEIDIKFAEDFKLLLLSAPREGNKDNFLSHNTVSTYFSIFKAALKQAFVDNYFMIDLSAKIKSVSSQEV